jgi:hypothetical protein
MLGSGEPRRSRRTKRDMLSRGVRYVESAGWKWLSHSAARDLVGSQSVVGVGN